MTRTAKCCLNDTFTVLKSAFEYLDVFTPYKYVAILATVMLNV